MRVTCFSIEEAIERLKSDGPSNIFRHEISLSKTKEPVDGDRRGERMASKFRVTLHLSAIMNLLPGDGQYLLQCGEECGLDYEDATQEKAGSVYAWEMEVKLRQFATEHGLSVKPGILQI